MNSSRLVRIVFAALAAAGCDQILVAKPKPSDLAGVYRLTADSEAFLKKDKGYSSIPPASIELRPDGTASLRDLPDCIVDGFGESNGAFVSGDGSWSIQKAFIGYEVPLDIRQGSMPHAIYGSMAIRRRSPPYELQITIGDPDLDESIRFQRAGS